MSEESSGIRPTGDGDSCDTIELNSPTRDSNDPDKSRRDSLLSGKSQTGCCDCSHSRRGRRISPDWEKLPNTVFFQISSKHKLRIVHINASENDSKSGGKRAVLSGNQRNALFSGSAMKTAACHELSVANSNVELTGYSSVKMDETVNDHPGDGVSKAETLPANPHPSSQGNCHQVDGNEHVKNEVPKGKGRTNSGISSVTKTGITLDLKDDALSGSPCGNIHRDEDRTTDRNITNESQSGLPASQLQQNGTIDANSNSHLVDSSSQKPVASAPAKTIVKDTVLFFIHGVAGSSDIWLSQLAHFKELGYEIIAPDILGHGFSSAPKHKRHYEFSRVADDMLQVFDAFCKKKNVVIGHSYGGSFATVIARKRARLVRKLVLINGGGPIPLAPNPGLFSLPVCMLACIHPLLKRVFNSQAFHKDTKSLGARDKAFDVPSYVLRHIMMGQNWEEGGEDYHKALNVPTLLIYGEGDQLVTLEEEFVMKETIYGCQLRLVQNAGHMTMMEQPEEVNQLLQEFIMDAPPTSKHPSPVSPRRALVRQDTAIRW